MIFLAGLSFVQSGIAAEVSDLALNVHEVQIESHPGYCSDVDGSCVDAA